MASKSQITPEEASTAEEITNDSVTPSTPSTTDSKPSTKNACTYIPQDQFPIKLITNFPTPVSTLMSASKPHRSSPSKPKNARSAPVFDGRNALGTYIASPALYPSSTVITYSDHFVTVRDRYPKASVHILLLPRDRTKTHLHPFEALADPIFCAKVQAEILSLKALVAKELKRVLGADSAQDRRRAEALDRRDDDDESTPQPPLPPGRDWSAEILAGVHAGPSMHHLHIHVLSRDSRSAAMRHRKHYNSFHTPFFVDINDFPLSPPGRATQLLATRASCLQADLKCWRCGERFGSGFAKLKTHLEEEFGEWKRL